MFISSPSANNYNGGRLVATWNSGASVDSEAYSGGSVGLRPLVCLKSGITVNAEEAE